jgi:hypothetical protein
MSKKNLLRPQARGATATFVAAFAAFFLLAQATWASTWKGIEPLISRRPDVERALGAPVVDRVAKDGSLQFKVAGGTVTVQFVDSKFVASKGLAPSLEGTVLAIVLQHDRSTDTPESLKVSGNKDFSREAKDNVVVFRNTKDGLFYTFVDGKLKTTRYAASTEQIMRAQRRG